MVPPTRWKLLPTAGRKVLAREKVPRDAERRSEDPLRRHPSAGTEADGRTVASHRHLSETCSGLALDYLAKTCFATVMADMARGHPQ